MDVNFKKAVLLWLLFVTNVVLYAGKPKWIHRLPEANNSTYTFVPIVVDAYNISSGRNESLKMLALDRGLLNTVNIKYHSDDVTVGQSNQHAKDFNEQIDTKTIEVTTFESKLINLQAQIVDEYYSKGQLTTLYRVGLTDFPDFDPLEVTTSYGARGVWRSIIVPGWGQMYKNSYLKGSLIMGGTIGLVAGIVVAENSRQDYVRYVRQTHDANIIRSYQSKINHLSTARNVCIGALSALYIWNLVDAIVAPGAKYVKFKDNKTKITPVAYKDGGVGMALTYNL